MREFASHQMVILGLMIHHLRNASGNDTVLSIKGKGSSYSGKIDFKDSSGNIDNSIASDNTIFMFNCDPNSQNGNTACCSVFMAVKDLDSEGMVN